jgi:hypothetical protein
MTSWYSAPYVRTHGYTSCALKAWQSYDIGAGDVQNFLGVVLDASCVENSEL